MNFSKKQELVKTKDGSHSIFIPEWNESYHSKHGAVQEAEHVFITNGFNLMTKKHIVILEIGFGTGLNAIVTRLAQAKNQTIAYHGIEKYPVGSDLVEKINYPSVLDFDRNDFIALHAQEWGVEFDWFYNFGMTKHQSDFRNFDYTTLPKVDLVYYDAFGPRVQGDLWNKSLLLRIYDQMNIGGRFTTYCCKGSVRRDLQSVGFKVDKVPGPPGKREMLIAIK